MCPPNEKGKELAAAFRKEVENTAYYRQDFDVDATAVPIERVREYARAACLCQLRAADAGDGPMLRDLFLSEPAETAPARRATFWMLLDIADQTDGHPVDQPTFRQLLFFGTASDGASYTPREGLADTHARWRLYQAREYYAFALTGMFVHLSDWGIDSGGDLRPLSFDALAEHIEAGLDFNRLAELVDLAAPGLNGTAAFSELLDWIASVVGATTESLDQRCGLDASLSEDALYRLGTRSGEPASRIAGGITMLASLFLRFGRPETWMSPAWTAVSRCGEDGRLSIHGFIRSLRARLRAGSPTIVEIAQWLMTDYVIRQHQIVATSKLPENTFRFEHDGNRLRFHRHYNRLAFSDSRFDALSTTAHELGFCGAFGAAEHGLTQAGRDLLLFE